MMGLTAFKAGDMETLITKSFNIMWWLIKLMKILMEIEKDDDVKES